VHKNHYHPISIFFHWLIFILLIVAFAAIELKGQFPKGSEPRELCKTIHGFIGQLIFIAMLLRLFARWFYGAPQPIPLSRPLLNVAKILHWTFYLLLITLPVMGLVFLQASGKAVSFGSWTWPELLPPNPSIKRIFKEVHEWLGNALYFLIGIHALAALWHHHFIKDHALQRMMNKIDTSS
jgi:cytochrome b561